jgi:hypothetical protein
MFKYVIIKLFANLWFVRNRMCETSLIPTIFLFIEKNGVGKGLIFLSYTHSYTQVD